MDAFLAWVKKYWQVIAAFAIAVVAFLLGIKVAKPKPSPVQPGPSDEQKKAEEETKKAEQQAADVRDKTIADAKTEHDQSVTQVIQDEQKKTNGLLNDSDALNQQLIDIGKKVRGG